MLKDVKRVQGRVSNRCKRSSIHLVEWRISKQLLKEVVLTNLLLPQG